ncbi:MAG: hypothetical protein V2A73_21665 [Pseudomonadota bacterium]
MLEAYHLGGWGMYLTTLFGVPMLLAAARYAWKAEKRYLPLAISLGILTFLSGCLGFLTGAIRTLQVASSGRLPEPPTILTMIGISESLHNVALALSLMIVAAMAATVGALRAARLTAQPRPTA